MNSPRGTFDDDDASKETSSNVEGAAEDSAREEVRAEGLILERAIGGWRGMIDTGLPTVVFITVFALNGRVLIPALIAAVVTGVLLVGWRLIQRQSLQQIFTGFVGLAIAAGFSAWTGNAEDFFLPGLLTNIGYGTLFLVSILVGWPALGVVMGYLTGDGTTWRSDTPMGGISQRPASW